MRRTLQFAAVAIVSASPARLDRASDLALKEAHGLIGAPACLESSSDSHSRALRAVTTARQTTTTAPNRSRGPRNGRRPAVLQTGEAARRSHAASLRSSTGRQRFDRRKVYFTRSRVERAERAGTPRHLQFGAPAREADRAGHVLDVRVDRMRSAAAAHPSQSNSGGSPAPPARKRSSACKPLRWTGGNHCGTVGERVL